MDQTQGSAVQALVEPLLAEHGMELVELTCRSSGGQTLVRLLVDKVGGVTIQQCARVNQLIGRSLEDAQLIAGGYTVEVSSPGLDRPLMSHRDFERAIGEEIRLSWDLGDGRPKDIEGQLLAVQPEAVVLKMAAGNVTVPLSQIRLAKKAIRW